MLKFLKVFTLACIVLLGYGIFQAVHADPLRYYGTPVFYGKFTPKVAHCTFDLPSKYGFCGWKEYPDYGVVGMSTMSGKKKGLQVVLYDEVICDDVLCQTNYSEPRGKIDSKGVSYWYIPKGFYLASINGIPTAVKYGNGPLTQSYPIRDVILPAKTTDYPDGAFIPVDNDDTYRVFCNPARECSYMGQVMEYPELKQYVAPVLTTRCNDLFCYNDRDQIVGTNPKTPY